MCLFEMIEKEKELANKINYAKSCMDIFEKVAKETGETVYSFFCMVDQFGSYRQAEISYNRNHAELRELHKKMAKFMHENYDKNYQSGY